MTIASINLVGVLDLGGVLLGTIAGFAFGLMYYTLLGKHWLDAIGNSQEAAKGSSALPFVTSFVSLLVMGSVLDWYFAQQAPEAVNSLYAIKSAAIFWLGFVVTSMATNNAFQGAKAKLTVLDSMHWFGVLVIQALIIARF